MTDTQNTEAFQPHQQRVVWEKFELDGRLLALSKGLNSGDLRKLVTDDEFSRLCEQERVMTEYSGILGKRIAAFRVQP